MTEKSYGEDAELIGFGILPFVWKMPLKRRTGRAVSREDTFPTRWKLFCPGCNGCYGRMTVPAFPFRACAACSSEVISTLPFGFACK